MGYGQIVGGMKQTAAAKRKGRGSRVMSKYQAARDAISATADTAEAIGHSLVSLHKGYSKGQTQWENLESGAAELGLEEQVADTRAKAGRWEKWTGPSEKTLESMIQGDEVVDGKRLEITAGELKTMGKIKRTQGARYLKTMDPTTGKYKDVKDSGWGQMKDVPDGETVESYSPTREKDYSNFPVAESLMNKTGETLGNIQGSLTEWWNKKGSEVDASVSSVPDITVTQSEVNQSAINAEAAVNAGEQEYIQNQLLQSEDGAVALNQYKEDITSGRTVPPGADPSLEINTDATSNVIDSGQGDATITQDTTPKMTRGQAFQNARKSGLEEFEYEGKKYHTRTKEDEDELSAIPEENFNMIRDYQ